MKKRKGCYLLHFDKPYKHARHYLGYTKDLDARLQDHNWGNGSGAALTDAARTAGITFQLARVWEGATRADERKLHRQGHNPRLCPMCNPKAAS